MASEDNDNSEDRVLCLGPKHFPKEWMAYRVMDTGNIIVHLSVTVPSHIAPLIKTHFPTSTSSKIRRRSLRMRILCCVPSALRHGLYTWDPLPAVGLVVKHHVSARLPDMRP